MDSQNGIRSDFDSKKLICVIEDDPFILEALTEILKEEGFDVRGACNGQEGIDFLRQSSVLPNLIILDLMMPVKDGFEFRKEQRCDDRLKEIPVVVMSANRNFEPKLSEVGGAAYLRKPVDLDELVGTVKRLCTSS